MLNVTKCDKKFKFSDYDSDYSDSEDFRFVFIFDLQHSFRYIISPAQTKTPIIKMHNFSTKFKTGNKFFIGGSSYRTSLFGR